MAGLAETPEADPIAEILLRYGIPVFYTCVAAGVALLAYGFISKSDGPARRRCQILGGLLMCLLVAARCQLSIDTDRGFIAEQDRRNDAKFQKIEQEQGEEEALKIQYMYMPAGNSLFYISLGNPSLAADYVWLSSLQFVSNSFRRHGKFDMLARFHRTMVDLDPHWEDAQASGAKVLSALINDEEKSVRRRLAAGDKLDSREKSEECYLYAIKQNPDSWRLLNEAGMLYVMPPNDPNKMALYSRRAAKYFEVALEKKTFPKELVKLTRDRIARLHLESGSAFYRVAEELMAKNATDPENAGPLQEISRRDWLRAHSMVQAAVLSDEAAAIKKATGAYPSNLEAILKHFNAEVFKTDAYGFPFDYDPAIGQATSHGAKALRAIQSGHVINDLVNTYRSEKNGKIPQSLAELRDFLRTYRQAPIYPPSVMVIEAIGKDLDATVGPLGPWVYDAEKGEVILPPECDIKALYGHVNDYEWKPTGIVKKSPAP